MNSLTIENCRLVKDTVLTTKFGGFTFSQAYMRYKFVHFDFLKAFPRLLRRKKISCVQCNNFLQHKIIHLQCSNKSKTFQGNFKRSLGTEQFEQQFAYIDVNLKM